MASEGRNSRRVCATCDQELALTAYYRHKADKNGIVCPGKRRKLDISDYDSDDEFIDAVENQVEYVKQFDSSFDVSEEEQGNFIEVDEPFNSSTDSDTFQFSDHESEEIQVWNEDGTEAMEVYDFLTEESDTPIQEEAIEDVKKVVFGINYFIVFFHFVFRASERSIQCLLIFLKSLMLFLAKIMSSQILSQISRQIPKTLYFARKTTLGNCACVEYVVCPKCSSIYLFSECVKTIGGKEVSVHCSYIEFPRHPHPNQRKVCDEVLLKEIKIGKKLKLVPRKVFIYRSVVESLKEMASRDHFLSKCELWRQHINFLADDLGDVYDGRLWNELQVINGRPFLSAPNNMCLALNIDWFNPYEQTPYSIGAIYLSILNLPRNERYKEENIILVGLIPGPTEPKQHINSFLSPLVADLKKLYEGVIFNFSTSGIVMLRAVLACVSCDLPATRKVCGFSSYNAKFGCSKCMKEFPTSSFGCKPNYGGYNCTSWTNRNLGDHIKNAKKYKNALTNAERLSVTQSSGVKFSVLIEAPGFNIVRYHIIDPMHCIFLGIAKHTVQVWKEKQILDIKKFKLIQEKIDCVAPPKNVGRIPRKIECGFSSLTADEWKNWIMMYSIFCLQDVVENTHLQCWSLFVKSCHILCQPVISKIEAKVGQEILIEFCRSFESLYGSQYCTPNMHMACHLEECILDFGPLLSFWCFPYERYNGVLEGFKKSWMQPEKQLFLKFYGVQQVQTLCNSRFLGEVDFLSTIKHEFNGDCSSYGQSQSEAVISKLVMPNKSCSVNLIDAEKKEFHILIPPHREKFFSEIHYEYLQEVYAYLYPKETVLASRSYLEYRTCFINCEEYISVNCRSGRSSAVAARWSQIRGGIDKFGEAAPRVGQIKSILVNEAKISGENGQCKNRKHIFVCIHWYEEHPQKHYFSPPVLLCTTMFNYESCAIFMPVSRILSRCAISSRQTVSLENGIDYAIAAIPMKNIM